MDGSWLSRKRTSCKTVSARRGPVCKGIQRRAGSWVSAYIYACMHAKNGPSEIARNSCLIIINFVLMKTRAHTNVSRLQCYTPQGQQSSLHCNAHCWLQVVCNILCIYPSIDVSISIRCLALNINEQPAATSLFVFWLPIDNTESASQHSPQQSILPAHGCRQLPLKSKNQPFGC